MRMLKLVALVAGRSTSDAEQLAKPCLDACGAHPHYPSCFDCQLAPTIRGARCATVFCFNTLMAHYSVMLSFIRTFCGRFWDPSSVSSTWWHFPCSVFKSLLQLTSTHREPHSVIAAQHTHTHTRIFCKSCVGLSC